MKYKITQHYSKLCLLVPTVFPPCSHLKLLMFLMFLPFRPFSRMTPYRGLFLVFSLYPTSLYTILSHIEKRWERWERLEHSAKNNGLHRSHFRTPFPPPGRNKLSQSRDSPNGPLASYVKPCNKSEHKRKGLPNGQIFLQKPGE